MRKRFFTSNLVVLLIPTLIPLILLGALSWTLTNAYLDSVLSVTPEDLLIKHKANIELILQETDEVHIAVASSPTISTKLWQILSSDIEAYNLLQAYEIIDDFLNANIAAKDFMESIYIYQNNPMTNKGKVLSTKHGLIDASEMTDERWRDSWMQSAAHKGFSSRLRTIQDVGVEERAIPVISLYRLIDPMQQDFSKGFIVINIKQAYINDQLSNLNDSGEQMTVILNSEQSIVAHSNNIDGSQLIELQKHLIGADKASESLTLSGLTYVTHQITSNKYGWTFMLFSPQETRFTWPNTLIYVTFSLVAASLMMAVILAFIFTRRNHKHITNIVDLLHYVQMHKKLPPVKPKTSQYDLITQNIISTFVEQEYLKAELERKQYRAQAMELTALQSQINPHFLFNTLESIKWQSIALTDAPNETTFMIEDLSEILTYTLRHVQKHALLRDEIRYTKVYLSIMMQRYPDKFDVLWEYDTEIEDYSSMKLLFQPFLENCIYHGIKEKSSPSVIRITITESDDKLIIKILDTGIGMSRESLSALRASLEKETFNDTHMGVYNTYKRLVLSYCDDFSFKILSKQGLGTLVWIEIPCEHDSDQP